MARPRRIVGPKELENAQTLQYTVPEGEDLVIVEILFICGGTARTCSIWLVPNGAVSILDGHRIAIDVNTDANDLNPLSVRIPLKPGDKIYTHPSNTGLNMIIVAEGSE